MDAAPQPDSSIAQCDLQNDRLNGPIYEKTVAELFIERVEMPDVLQ